jgi:uncharacterized membrane protein YgcG
MGFRQNAVKAFATLLGVDGGIEKALPGVPTSGAQGQPVGPPSQSNQLPAEWMTATYAPGWPIQSAERPDDVAVPREIDYPVAVNATLQPRTAYGLMPFAALKEAYETVAEIRLPVSTLLREITIFHPHLVDKEGGEIDGHDLEWLIKSPDRVTPFDVWLTRFLKSSSIFDAGAFFFQMNHDNLEAVKYIDGSTLFIMVDEYGQVPKPTDKSKDPEVLNKWVKKLLEWEKQGKQIPRTTPAYAQVIKGTPFGWYDQNQIWYKPRSRRFDSPYGETAIEQAWAWIMICANITGFELAHYREGNMPEGWVSAPDGWTLERIAAFEKAFNDRMSSGAAERMRARWLPHGSEWHETKKPEFPTTLYDQASSMISLFFGVPPSEYGKTPGAGLGGSGFEEAMQSTLFRMGLLPLKGYIEDAFNEILRRAGVDDAWFELAFPNDQVDPEKQRDNIINLFSNGLITFNSALSQLGQDQIEGGDVHLLIEYGGFTIIEEELAKPAEQRAAEAAAAGGGLGNVPLGTDKAPTPKIAGKNGKAPEVEANLEAPPPTNGKERKEPATKKDKKLAEKMLATRSLNPDGRFISLPPVKVHGITELAKDEQIRSLPQYPRTPIHGGHFAPHKHGTDSAKQFIENEGGEVFEVDMDEYRRAVEEEANEHPTVVGDDISIAETIVQDHLREDPEYYSKKFNKGGAGSGNFGHSGRTGVRGGSGGGGMVGGGTMPNVIDLIDDLDQTASWGIAFDGRVVVSKPGREEMFDHDILAEENGYGSAEDFDVRGIYGQTPDEGNPVFAVYTDDESDSGMTTQQKMDLFAEKQEKISRRLRSYDLLQDQLPAFYTSPDAGASGIRYDFKSEKLLKADDHDGVMVALDVPDAIGKQLRKAAREALPKDIQIETLDNLHVTLFYPGDIDNLDFNEAQLVEAVKDFAASRAPLVGVIGGVARFNPPLKKGGSGSGNFGHSGRAGVRGGSGGGGMVGGGGGKKYPPANPNGADTMEQFMNPDGTWTPERQALHDEIINKAFEGKTPVDNPQSYILGGGPAAGKTTALRSGLVDVPENHVLAAGDDIKEMLPEYEGANASLVHEESSYLAKQIAAKAASKNYNTVMDGTGDNSLSSLEKKVASMSPNGQPVHGIYVTVDTETAVARAISRAEKTGRYMPESILRANHASVSQIYPQASSLFSTTQLLDTNGSTVEMIASSVGDTLTVLDKTAYDAFIAKGAG